MQITPKLDYGTDELCRTIASIPDDVLFFCDTSLFDDKTDMRLYSELLDREGRIVIIPPVRRELDPWLDTHSEHPVAKAILGEERSIKFIEPKSDHKREESAAEYYVNLLGFRKMLLTLEFARFEQKSGQPPNNDEAKLLMQKLHQDIGSRGYILAKKGYEAAESPNLFTDEILVYLAMKTAIETGQDIVIVSKDEDILEQFYKLQWLLDTHYRSMLFADVYASDPSRFVTHSMPKVDTPWLKNMFVGDDNYLVERQNHFIIGDSAPILPPYCHPVVVHCWIVGDKISQMAFCAEKEMKRLLDTKGATSGLNTYKFGEKNCHLWLAPLDAPRSLRGCVAIADDDRVDFGLARIPLLDTNQAIFTGERFMHGVET